MKFVDDDDDDLLGIGRKVDIASKVKKMLISLAY